MVTQVASRGIELSVLDLFCGCGGLSLGAHMAGMQTAVAIDIDTTLSSAFGRNFPASRLLDADLSKLTPAALERDFQVSRPTAILGGPPCQGFSAMGRRNGSDPRNNLLRVFFEFVAHFRPSFFIMENVPGLREPKNRDRLDKALDLLPGRYKCLEPTILDAADYGAATTRPRLVVIGYDPEYVDQFDISDLKDAERKGTTNVRSALLDLPKLSPNKIQLGEWLPCPTRPKLDAYAQMLRRCPPKSLGDKASANLRRHGLVSGCQHTRHTTEVVERFAKLNQGERDPISKYQRLRWDKPAYVLRAGTGADRGSYQAARPIHPRDPRVITVREAARVQGFPDWFQFHPTKWHSHRMIGNSVSPVFAKAILDVLLSKLGRSREMIAA